VGLANLEKNHCGMKTCLKAKAKHHKEEKEAKPYFFSTTYNVFCWRYPHEIGYAKPARHLVRVEDQNDQGDDVIFPYIDMCLIT